MKADLYLLARQDDAEAVKLEKSLDTLKITGSTSNFSEKGFTEFNAGTLYRCWNITGRDGYEVSFDISIAKKTMKVKSFMVLDENFGQPHFTNREYNKKIKEILDQLKAQELITYKSYF